MATRKQPAEASECLAARSAPSRAGLFVGPIFLIVALWFVWDPAGVEMPDDTSVVVDPLRLTTEPRRVALHDPPRIEIDGFERTCMSCHRLFPPRLDTPRELLQHQHVVLNHGINDRCRNCHYDKDRDKLVLRGGKVIGYGEVVELCAKCHGPTYRDWQRGAHGRTNGYWDTSRGEMRRLTCTECHDPHNPQAPAMDPIAPLPGPNTLRMRLATQTDHDSGESRGDRRDPLRWRSIETDTTVLHTPALTDPPVEELEYLDEHGEGLNPE